MSDNELFLLLIFLFFVMFGTSTSSRSSGCCINEKPTKPRPNNPPKAQMKKETTQKS